MKHTPLKLLLAALALFHSTMPFAGAITVGMVDTFTGSLDNWQKGQVNPAFLSVISSGGPAGDGDSYLRSVADGSSSFGRLTIFNQSQWNSNFATDGITSIRMDLLNSGNSTLQIRLGLRNSAGAGFISTTPFALSAVGVWQPAEFSLEDSAFTAVGSPGAFSNFLSNPFALRILHATGTSNLNGTPVVSTLGVDNITAVPEPKTIALLLVGAAILALKKRRQA